MCEDSQNKLAEYLTEIKMRINAYGKVKNNILMDNHIWKSIDLLENNKKRTNIEKNKLIDYLSLLLKYDWERSKNESSFNILAFLSYSIFIVSNILFAYFITAKYDGSIETCILYIIVFGSVFFVPQYVVTFINSFKIQPMWWDFIVPNAVTIFLYLYVIIKFSKVLKKLNLPICLQLIGLILLVLSNIKTLKNNIFYCKRVNSVNDLYEERVSSADIKETEVENKPLKIQTNNNKMKKVNIKQTINSNCCSLLLPIKIIFIYLKFVNYFLYLKLFYKIIQKEKECLDKINQKCDDLKDE